MVATNQDAEDAARRRPGTPAGGIVANAAALAAHGMTDLRALALRVAAAGVAACDPARATRATVSLEEDGAVRVGDAVYPLASGDRVVVVGAGKASAGIAEELERILGPRLAGGAVAVPAGASTRLERIETLTADHPVPSERSVAAARRLFDWTRDLREGDLVLACFTGGSSALASLPPAGVPVADKQALTRVLLGSGLPITTTNLVRRHVSEIKGGRLARAIAPARLVNLTVSDVVGDPLEAITDPTVGDPTNPADAAGVLRDHGIWRRMPRSVREHLEDRATAPPAIHEPQTVVLASGRVACDAMRAEAERCGVPSVVLSTSLEGEGREIGRILGILAQESARHRTPFAPPCLLLGCGGEATVTLPKGDGLLGRGGPNQEAATALALELEASDRVAALFMDSDGSDGGTPLAGGVVDGSTRARAAAAGADLARALREHQTSAALEALGDGIVTGWTGTNVNDLFVIAIGARP